MGCYNGKQTLRVYKAVDRIITGQTLGHTYNDQDHTTRVPPKDIDVYHLIKNFPIKSRNSEVLRLSRYYFFLDI